MNLENVIRDAEDHLYRARRAKRIGIADQELRALLDMLDQELNE